MTITDAIHHAVLKIPASVWAVAVEPGGVIRDGAQLRFTDDNGMHLTCFATNTKNAAIAELELGAPSACPR